MFSKMKINLSKQRNIVENLFYTLIRLKCVTREDVCKALPEWKTIDEFIEKYKVDSEESIF